MRVALVSRELYPVYGGGIGHYVTATAGVLAQIAEVTIFTTSRLEHAVASLRAAGDTRLPGDDVTIVFVPEPSEDELPGWDHVMHPYSARVLDRLREVYGAAGPDIVEFPDFLGEGFVTVQAADALDPFLRDTHVCVRLHTNAELCGVLDGFYGTDAAAQTLYAMERHALVRADRLLWQGGDVLATYKRYYDGLSLAPADRVRAPFPVTSPAALPAQAPSPDGPLKVLYAGRLERRKGVLELVRAVTGMATDDLRLTLVGNDTATAPLGTSMHQRILEVIGDDPRIAVHGGVDPATLTGMIDASDLVVLPSRWECWPYVALEALSRNRPLLATPVGGHTELVNPDVSGWLTRGTSEVHLREGLQRMVDDRAAVRELARTGGPRKQADWLTEPSDIRAAYAAIASDPTRRTRRRVAAQPPVVSAVVPYFRMSEYIAETIEALAAQTYPRLEIIVVNDGSYDPEDRVIDELAARFPLTIVSKINAGLSAARNTGVLRGTGRYFFPLDADNLVEPDFVARAVEILEARTDVAYVTSWSHYMDPDGVNFPAPHYGYQPLGNDAALNQIQNVAGDAAAVVRRHLFDSGFRYNESLTCFEDWHYYRRLQQAGHFGAIIPERLLRYRVRPESMQRTIGNPNKARLLGEIEGLLREEQIRWTASTA